MAFGSMYIVASPALSPRSRGSSVVIAFLARYVGNEIKPLASRRSAHSINRSSNRCCSTGASAADCGYRGRVSGRLVTERLILCPWTVDDAGAALGAYGDAEVARWLTPAM